MFLQGIEVGLLPFRHTCRENRHFGPTTENAISARTTVGLSCFRRSVSSRPIVAELRYVLMSQGAQVARNLGLEGASGLSPALERPLAPRVCLNSARGEPKPGMQEKVALRLLVQRCGAAFVGGVGMSWPSSSRKIAGCRRASPSHSSTPMMMGKNQVSPTRRWVHKAPPR
jgi:hypothetical protein